MGRGRNIKKEEGEMEKDRESRRGSGRARWRDGRRKGEREMRKTLYIQRDGRREGGKEEETYYT